MKQIIGQFRLASLACAFAMLIAFSAAMPVHAENNGVAVTPGMGWSSWSYFKSSTDLNESVVKAEAQVMASQLKASGYIYVNIDDYYYVNPNNTVDAYGRWVPDP